MRRAGRWRQTTRSTTTRCSTEPIAAAIRAAASTAAPREPASRNSDPEFLTDVELGTKNNWTILDVPGRTNFDLYYGWYQDIQKNDEVAIETPSSERVVALTANAAKAEIKGLEFELTFIPDDNFQVTAFYSSADASYSKFELPQAIFIDPLGNVTLINPLDHKGDPFAFTPKHKLGFTGRYHLPVDSALGTPYLTATWYWQSKVWFTDLADLEPQAFQADYGLVNLRLDWNSFLGSSFDASVFVNNLTDRTYKVGANAMEHLTGTTSSIYAAPRMFGVELRYRFGAGGCTIGGTVGGLARENWYSWVGSNHRPPDPQSGALTN